MVTGFLRGTVTMTLIADSVLVLGWIEYKIPLQTDYSTKQDRGQTYFIG